MIHIRLLSGKCITINTNKLEYEYDEFKQLVIHHIGEDRCYKLLNNRVIIYNSLYDIIWTNKIILENVVIIFMNYDINIINNLRKYGLQHLSPELQNDPEIVKLAVITCSFSLRYASPELQNDPEIVSLAVQKYGYALEHASPELQNNPEIVKLAVHKNGESLKYASQKIRNNREIVKLAIQQCVLAFYYASEELQLDPEIVEFRKQQDNE
jgi:hypothetical protein